MSLERPTAPDPYDLLPPKPSFTLESDEVRDGELMGPSFVHPMAGGTSDHSPQLRWSGFPAETKSFTITCFDPDAPTHSGFWHWLLVNVPADVTELASGAGSGGELPAGAFHVRNDYGEKAWGGAAPPEGDPPHRYVFAVHAVDVDALPINEDVSPAFVGFNLVFHTLARATMRPLFSA
jgi:Raf kinase inhibitor-like YbhB/YbcL family protein